MTTYFSGRKSVALPRSLRFAGAAALAWAILSVGRAASVSSDGTTGALAPTTLLTLTDADVHKFVGKYEITYLIIKGLSGDEVICRQWRVTDLSGATENSVHKWYLKDFSTEDQTYIKSLVAQRAKDAIAEKSGSGSDGAIHIAAWDGVIGASDGQPYLVDTSGVLKGKSITAITGDAGSHVVLCSDGTLAAWGDNSGGQLGNGKSGPGEYRVSPVLMDLKALKGKNVTAIKGNRSFLCSDGSIYQTIKGTLGIYDPRTRNSDASALLKGKQITDVTSSFGLLACSDGTLLAWDGDKNKYVQVNAMESLKGKTPAAISVGGGVGHYLVLCTDGTIVHWGFCSIPGIYGAGRPVFDDISAIKELKNPLLDQVKQLVLEYEKSLGSASPAILADDTGILKGKTVTAVADFENGSDPLGVASGIANLKRVQSAFGSTIFALCSDGTIACWGAGKSGPFPFSVNDKPGLKDALKGETITSMQKCSGGLLLACSNGTLILWTPWSEKTAIYHYFDGKTILAMDSNAVVFK